MPALKKRSFKQRAISVAVASCYVGSALANPTGESVVSGSASFSRSGNSLSVTNTPGAIINWQQFSIQKDEVTRFIQQNASSAVLNRVTTQNPSVILGTLSSNGRVFLINPSGIAFGQGSIINVAGLAASTLDISDANFSAGRLKFEGTGQEGRLRNSGKITTSDGGHVYLIAPNVRNGKSGVITTPKGEVVIAAGTSVELVNPQTPDLRVQYTAPANTAVNAGQIIAESGRIGVYGTLIKNSGVISATAATVGEGGKIVLRAVKDVNLLAGSRVEANGSRGGDVIVQAETGTLLAQGVVEAKGAVDKGGSIQLLGKQVALDGTASVDASGNAGGGRILIGGDVRGANPDVQNADAVYIGADASVKANAGETGDGGSVVVYSNNSTKIYGSISARGSSTGTGGSVETSGHYLEVAQAPDVGAGGNWLIDPYNIEIVVGNGTTNNTGTPDFTPNGDDSQIGATLISNQLNAGTSVTVDTGGAGSPGTQPGNLTVNGSIVKSAPPNAAALTLNAASDVTVNANISLNSGNLAVNAGNNMTVNNSSVNATTMSVSAGGTVAVVGTTGSAALTAVTGQTVTAGAVDVRSQGANATIQNVGPGDQTITVNAAGPGTGLQVRSTAAGPGNVGASIFSGNPTGTQTITVNNGDVNLNAGFNNAVIQTNGTQNITANGGNVTLANSTTGFNNSFAGMLAPNQTITANDVTLNAGFATGTTQGVRIGGLSANPPTGFPGSATNLTINATNVTLNALSGAVNGSALGTSGSVAMDNNITINAAGGVIMNSGPNGGNRIGSGAAALAGGNIAISAGVIQQNGATQPNAIRTTGNVSLSTGALGGSITQAPNSFIRAGTLTTNSNGDTLLAGPNQVGGILANAGGSVQLNNAGALAVNGITASGTTGIANAGSITVGGVITSGGNVDIAAAGAGSNLTVTKDISSGGGTMNLNVAGTLTIAASGAQNANVVAATGQTVNAQAISISAADGRQAGLGNAGSGAQTIGVSGGTGIDVVANSGLAIIANTGGNQTITAVNSDRINVRGVGVGSQATIAAANGVQTISITGSGMNAINLGAAGSLGSAQIQGRSQSITAGLTGESGSISITGPSATPTPPINTSITTVGGPGLDTQSVSTSGALAITGGSGVAGPSTGIMHNRAGQQTITAASIALQGGSAGSGNAAIISSGAANAAQLVNAGSISLAGGAGGTNNTAQLTNNGLAGTQTVTAASISVTGGAAGNNNGAFLVTNGAGGTQTITANSISATGGTVGAGNRVGISTANADQNINGNPTITVTGGASGGISGNGNSATISANGTGRTQTIFAGSMTLTSGAAGTDNSASAIANTQNITALGDVRVSGSGSGGNSAGSRIGSGGTLATNLTLNAGGDVVLTAGSGALAGARLGAAVNTVPVDSNVKVTANNVILNSGSAAGASIGYSTLSTPGGGLIDVTATNAIQLNSGANANAIRTTGSASLKANTITGASGTQVLVGNLTTNTTGSTNLAGSNQITSFNGTTTAGDLTLNNAGALNLAMTVNGAATITNAGSVTVSGIATSTGNQTVAVTGGNLDVQSTGGLARLATTGPGASQTLSVTNGDRISVNGAIGDAQVTAAGVQNISITGTGANAIVLGSATATGGSTVIGQTQTLTAGNLGESGSIAVTGAAANGKSATLQTSGGPGSQTISTSGALTVTGGTAPNNNVSSGLFHFGAGQQTINAATVALQGGLSGNGNGAFISSQTATSGAQKVTAGSISVTGGQVGVGNIALLRTVNADQTIDGNPTITVTGGANGGVPGNGNFASISAGGTGRTQTINAGSLTVTSGASGTDNSASVQGNIQNIGALGDVRVSGSGTSGNSAGARIGSGGTLATNLTVNAGGDVVLTGGSGTLAGARLGAAVNATPVDSNVKVTAGGNVVLNSGPTAGASIGYSVLSTPGGGTLDITAGNAIQLNTGANPNGIRTTGNVSLKANTITGEANTVVLANGLTTNSTGATTLTGSNQVASFNGTTTAGDLSLSNSGPLNLAMSVNGAATVNNTGSVTVGSNATSTGNQTISVTGGNLDIQNLTGGQITVAATGPGASQTLSVTNGDRISMNGAAGGVFVSANGTQTLSITGSGTNAINVGSAGALGQSFVNGRNQVITAGNVGESGAITIVGTAATNTLAGFVSQQGPGQTQSVSTSGALTITGGSAASQAPGFNTGVFHNGTGAQTVNAGSIAVTGGTTGNNNGAFIASQFGGAQSITAGNIAVTGGTGNSGSRAVISTTNADQTINAAAITVTGGASGGVVNSSNLANIGANGAGRTQTINASSIAVTGGAGGTDNSATISGNTQNFNVAGNVTVSGGNSGGNLTGARIGGQGTSGPTSTNLTLNAGGDVVLTGGGNSNAGARLGSTVVSTPLDSNVTVNASNVILNEGAGAGGAIGYSALSAVPGGGTINVNASNAIQMNGVINATSIRTTGNVNLNAATISQGSNGRVLANNLTTSTSGSTGLGGQNQIASFNGTTTGGDLTLNNTGALNLAMNVNGAATVTNAGSVTVTGSATSTGNQTLNVNGGSLNVTGSGTQNALLSSNGGQTINANSLSVTAADGRSAVVLNSSGNQTISVAGGAGIDVQALSGSAVISNATGVQTISASNADHIAVNAAGPGSFASISTGPTGAQSISITGSGANALRVGSTGALGTSSVNALTQTVTAGLSGEAGSISVTGSDLNNTSSFISTISAPGGSQSIATSGAISIAGGRAPSQAANRNSGIFNNGTGAQTVSAGSITIQGGSTGNTNGAGISNNAVGSAQLITAGSVSVNGGTSGNGNNAFISSNGAGATQTINAGNISVTGGELGAGNRATVSTANADQVINAAAITVTGGASGGVANNPNNANIGANGAGRTQSVNASSITITGGAGGTENSATMTGPNQVLTVAGDLRVTGGNSGGTLTGARIGGGGTNAPTNTNLTINAGGDVVLTGGTQTNAGARLGSTLVATPLDNNITVNAANVVLNEGPTVGAAIGYSSLSPAAGGTINVNAGNSIQMNGTTNQAAIRTTGNVNLNAATITQGSNGRVLANTLTTNTSGSTGLGGQNQVASFNGTTTGGDLTLNNTGTLNLAMNVNGAATVTNAGSVTVGSNAISTGNQTISVTGGNLDVQNLTGGQISLSATGAGANQTLSVTNGDHISFNGAAGGVFVGANATQTISITGSGANAINVGSAGALGQSFVNGRNQAITAGNVGESGSIGIVGSAATNALAGFVSQQGPGQTQSVSTTGALTVTGGTAASQAAGFNAGVFHNGTGAQTVNAGSIAVTGGASGNNNGAFIASQFGGAQVINVAGNLGVTGGSGGTNNRASVSSNGSQTINAGSISVTAGSGGTDNSATIVGVSQLINSVTNVFVTGGATTGTLNGARIGGLGGAGGPTNLVLGAGGDVVITGGSAALSGARLGSTISASPLESNVTVNAGGSVILNEGSGAGAAIGYSVLSVPAGGTISVTAGNDIQLNGTAQATAIRTTGNVDLHAGGAITEGANGFILANGLTTTSGGNTSLTGPNQVSSFNGASSGGDVSLSNIGGLNLTGLAAAGSGTLAAESVNGAGNVSTGTGFSVTVASDSLLSGVISGAGGLNKQGGGTLTVSGNNTYAGDTNVLAGTLALGGTDRTNSGVVNISSGATYRGSAGTFTNAGAIGGNGTLDVTGTSFTNTGTLRPGGAGAIGTLTVAGNATLGATSVVDIEAQSAASYDVLAITGAAGLGGNLNVTPINGYAPANGDTLTPLTYASRAGTVYVPGTWLPTYNPTNLQLGFDSTINRWVGTTGNWNVDANWSRGHTPLASETVLIDVQGNQLVTVSNGSRFAGKLVSFEDFLLSGGSLSLGGSSSFNGAFSLTGGTLQGAGNVTASGPFTWTGGTLGGTGQFLTAPGSIVTLSPAAGSLQLERNWTNQGFVTWQGTNGRDLVIADGATLVNALGGVVTLAAAQGSNIKGDGALRNEGTLNMEGSERTTIKAFFTNGPTGTLNVDSGTLRLKRSTSNEGSVGVAAGATLEVKGGDYVNNGLIFGNGTLDVGGNRLNNLGVLAPGANNGASIGTFTVQGDYYQAPTGVLQMGLGGVAAGQYDVLAVTGKASLGGTLSTSAVNGYVPMAGDTFKLITYKSRSGQFTTLQAPAPFALDADYEKRFGLFTLE